MNHLENFLGGLVVKRFDDEYPEWRESFKFILNYFGVSEEEAVQGWFPERYRDFNYRGMIEFILRKYLKFGFLCRFPIDIFEDHYGKELYGSRIIRISVKDFLEGKDAYWVIKNEETFRDLQKDDVFVEIEKLQNDYNKRFDTFKDY